VRLASLPEGPFSDAARPLPARYRARAQHSGGGQGCHNIVPDILTWCQHMFQKGDRKRIRRWKKGLNNTWWGAQPHPSSARVGECGPGPYFADGTRRGTPDSQFVDCQRSADCVQATRDGIDHIEMLYNYHWRHSRPGVISQRGLYTISRSSGLTRKVASGSGRVPWKDQCPNG